jgi:hypothetical protein
VADLVIAELLVLVVPALALVVVPRARRGVSDSADRNHESPVVVVAELAVVAADLVVADLAAVTMPRRSTSTRSPRWSPSSRWSLRRTGRHRAGGRGGRQARHRRAQLDPAPWWWPELARP